MTNQQNIATIQQKFIIQIDDKTLKRVKPFDRAELVQAYMQLFSGFSWVNWTNGHSLGRAWQTALTQCGTFCESKNKKNPAAKYLKATFNGHKKYWSQIIMTHNNRENKINQDDRYTKKLRQHGQRMIREAMDKINLILARYNEYTLEISRNATATMEASTKTSAHQPQNNNTQAQPAQAMAQQPAIQKVAVPQRQAQSEQAKQAQHAQAMVQQPAIQKVAIPQRQAQSEQAKQAQPAQVMAQQPAIQKVAVPQRQAQSEQAKQAQPAQAMVQQPAIQKVAVPQRQTQSEQAKQAQPAQAMVQQPAIQKVAIPQRQAQPAQDKKPYVAPEMSVRENQFAKLAQQSKTESKTETFTTAQMQIKRQINVFMFKNFNQRAA